MFGTIQKVSKIVLVVYKDDVFFLAGAASCGFILQGICKIYDNSQNRRHRRHRRRIINFIARKGGRIAFFGAFAIRTAPKILSSILSSRAFRELIYRALPYNFSDAEKKRRLIISVTNDKISYKLKLFLKILEWGSTSSLITVFIIYLIQTLLLNPEIWEFAFSVWELHKNVMIHMWTGQIPNDKTFVELCLLWRFFMGGYQ